MFVKRMTKKTILWIKVIWAALSSRSNQVFYDKISPFYDDIYVEHKVHAETIINKLGKIYSGREEETLVLDLGCGTGMMTKILSEKGFKVIGLDISFSSLCVHHEHHPKHYLIQADANFLPFSNDTFHTVVCLGVWRHFPDIENILDEVSRILIGNGNFIVGYFPPAMAGSITLKDNWWGKLLIWLYQIITRGLGYIDRADFSLEDETIEMSMKKFKRVSKIPSDLHRHLLFAQYPSKDHCSLQPIIRKTQEERLKILRCPYCVSSKERVGHLKLISNNWLICKESGCDRKYPIRKSIPVLLLEEGEKWIGVAKENLPDPLLSY